MAHGVSARPVIVGLDGSDASLAAGRFAVDEAKRRSAPLLLLAAVQLPPDWLAIRPHVADLPAQPHEKGRATVERAMHALAGLAGDVHLSTSVVDGHPVDVLHDASQQAQLIVLGSRGGGGVPGLALGSTASRVVAHAGCPVVVLPDDFNVLVRDRRSVVVGVEGRQGDEEVLAFAFDEAARRGTDLLAVHAWQEVRLDAPLGTVTPLVDWAGDVADEERVLAEALAGWREKEPGVAVRQAVLRDRSAHALLRASTTAQLLVVGHRARGAVGSTTHGVLHRAACPIAVVPVAPGPGR